MALLLHVPRTLLRQHQTQAAGCNSVITSRKQEVFLSNFDRHHITTAALARVPSPHLKHLRQDGFFVAADDIDAAQRMLGLFWGSHLGQVGQHWYQTPVDPRQTLKTNDANPGQLSNTVFLKLSYTQQCC